MHCPAIQAPLAGPIGLQRLFSIFSQFAIGENRHDIHPALGKALPLCRLLPAPGSNPSACLASPAPWAWAHMFSFPQICAAPSTSPCTWPQSWFPAGLRDGSTMGRFQHGCRRGGCLTGWAWEYGSVHPKWLESEGVRQAGCIHGRIFPLFAPCFLTVNLMLRPSVLDWVF